MATLPEPISHTVEAIYAALAARARAGDSAGIPMSAVGIECDRAIWYALRWSAPLEQPTGQKERLFETGRIEETRLLDYLEAAGFEVTRFDPATGRQFRVELADGWLRGKIDGRALGLPEAPKTEHAVECKSHNDRSFKELLKHKNLRIAKPDHFAQCQAYMHGSGLTRALYIAVNKNTDELYVERIKYDAAFAFALEARVARLVHSDRAPPRLHDDPTSKAAFACQWCPAKSLCHEGAFARVNCRTCIHARFDFGAKVYCVHHGRELSYAEQQVGCNAHRYVPDFVPGEQVDVRNDAVVYRLTDGSEWIDGAANAA